MHNEARLFVILWGRVLIEIFRPPYKTYRGNFNYYPMKIGDYVHIGAGSVVEAATIGNNVEIGKNCVIVRASTRYRLSLTYPWQGKFTIIKDCAKIADNTILPPNTVVPALALFSGSPGRYTCPYPLVYDVCLQIRIASGHFIEELPETTQERVESTTKQYYTRFVPAPERTER